MPVYALIGNIALRFSRGLEEEGVMVIQPSINQANCQLLEGLRCNENLSEEKIKQVNIWQF